MDQTKEDIDIMKTFVEIKDTNPVIRIKTPEPELAVLCILKNIGESHAPAICRASQGTISVAAIYRLLSRLENRSLVLKRTDHIQVGDITCKRVFYRVHEAVTLPKENQYVTNTPEQSAGEIYDYPVQTLSNNQEVAQANIR